jgi:hypothetical protein
VTHFQTEVTKAVPSQIAMLACSLNKLIGIAQSLQLLVCTLTTSTAVFLPPLLLASYVPVGSLTLGA